LSLEGKRRAIMVHVKLIRSQNNCHVKHIDGRFCTFTIKHLEPLSSLFGPNQVYFISHSYKAHVPIGITPANSQSPMLMHIKYRVTLPDPDWVIAARNKLDADKFLTRLQFKKRQSIPYCFLYIAHELILFLIKN
jgi:hypothetical protein